MALRGANSSSGPRGRQKSTVPPCLRYSSYRGRHKMYSWPPRNTICVFVPSHFPSRSHAWHTSARVHDRRIRSWKTTSHERSPYHSYSQKVSSRPARGRGRGREQTRRCRTPRNSATSWPDPWGHCCTHLADSRALQPLPVPAPLLHLQQGVRVPRCCDERLELELQAAHLKTLVGTGIRA